MVSLKQLDLTDLSVRQVNEYLHGELLEERPARVEILNPDGLHSIAAGLDTEVEIDILGHAGYFIAGMNQQARVTIHGNVGWSVAENMMSGVVRVKGHASECAGASGHGGLLVIEGDASSRCGISLKGTEIVVGGNVGHFSAFMAQAGTLVVCGDAGPNLGDSLYEATIYVRGSIHSFGADAREEEMQADDFEKVTELLSRAEMNYDAREFKRVSSARSLYHWNADAHQEY
ncbi:GXGXG motif protein [Gimesia panareensis]|uniref:GXGXG motif protein n=1 Tax=Gimesia panareensis TaxID=2527978 RepID=A0A518FVS2_9PLAN|nr:protein glxC [Gimesia panareensis]QDV20453.1 GXGXG motif protein [Gimesia panareensis]